MQELRQFQRVNRPQDHVPVIRHQHVRENPRSAGGPSAMIHESQELLVVSRADRRADGRSLPRLTTWTTLFGSKDVGADGPRAAAAIDMPAPFAIRKSWPDRKRVRPQFELQPEPPGLTPAAYFPVVPARAPCSTRNVATRSNFRARAASSAVRPSVFAALTSTPCSTAMATASSIRASR